MKTYTVQILTDGWTAVLSTPNMGLAVVTLQDRKRRFPHFQYRIVEG